MNWFSTMNAGGETPDAVIGKVGPAFGEAKVLKVGGFKAPGDPLEFWLRAGETLGEGARFLEDSVSGEAISAGGGWMDVRYEPDRLDTYRHANVGQPLHSDGAYSSQVQDIGLFYLERQASEGGESLFVDAEDVARHAAAVDPALHHALFSTAVRFGKGTNGRTTPILSERDGRLKVNWNWFRVMPDQGYLIAKLREDFRLLLEGMVETSPAVASFRLKAGEAMFFRDDEVLHGRRSYAAEVSGDRLLWKTYFTSPQAQAQAQARAAADAASAAA